MVVQFDADFPKAFPYGVLKTIQWVSPLAVLITIYLGSYIYPSVTFVLFTSWVFFFIALGSWVCHGLGLQHRVRPQSSGSSSAQAYVFVPFALIDFVSSVAGTICFGIGSLICVIAMFNGLSYRTGLFLTYLFATTFCLIAGGAFGYFAILIYRACPNGNLSNLKTMVVKGREITAVSIDGHSMPPHANINLGGPTTIITK